MLVVDTSDVLVRLELVWHLAEILLLDSQPAGLVLPSLLHWVSLHFPGCEERARSVLSQGSEEPEQHADYWEAVQRFVLQGRLEQVCVDWVDCEFSSIHQSV